MALIKPEASWRQPAAGCWWSGATQGAAGDEALGHGPEFHPPLTIWREPPAAGGGALARVVAEGGLLYSMLLSLCLRLEAEH